MDLPDSVLGSNVTAAVKKKTAAPLLRIGSDVFYRRDLAAVECFNFNAAASLSAILNHELNVKNTRDVFDRVSPAALVLPRLGAISLAVLGAAFEAKGIGGHQPLLNYYKQHLNGDRPLVTFSTLKDRDAAEVAKETKTRKQRKTSRRNTAHGLRVERFNARHAKASDRS